MSDRPKREDEVLILNKNVSITVPFLVNGKNNFRISGITPGELLKKLCIIHPKVLDYFYVKSHLNERTIFKIDEKLVSSETELKDGDTIEVSLGS